MERQLVLYDWVEAEEREREREELRWSGSWCHPEARRADGGWAKPHCREATQVGEAALEAVLRIEVEAAAMAAERERTEALVEGLRTVVEAAATAAMHAEALAAESLSQHEAAQHELVAGLAQDLDHMHSKLTLTQEEVRPHPPSRNTS